MPHKEGKQKVTLTSILDEMRSFKNEVIERFDKLDKEHEKYFTAIQDDLLELRSDVNILKEDVSQLKTDVEQLKTDVSQLKKDSTDTKQQLKEFRAETVSFHRGFASKSGRTDAWMFHLTSILQSKDVLSPEQTGMLQTF